MCIRAVFVAPLGFLSFFVPLVAALVNLGLLHWKRHSHPWNFVHLSTFTLLEGCVGFQRNACAPDLSLNVLPRLIDTYLIPFLFAALIVLLATSAVHFLVARLLQPEPSTIVYTLAGCLVFSGCVVYDTYRIQPSSSGAISLDLDFISLCMSHSVNLARWPC
ncbi:hypothetical protein B0H14DRAFT_2778553 [Mycena olivaceomarginata]|nr:hypothetical protein B0H14DRAFT_2778553 [Mycena olivaceomarginata]